MEAKFLDDNEPKTLEVGRGGAWPNLFLTPKIDHFKL